MIQDPTVIPKSLEVAGWIGGASFTLWIVKVAFELFKKSQSNGKTDALKKAVDWALHLKEQDELHECTKEIVKTQTNQAQLLERLTISYERQTELLESINLANKRG